MIFPVSATEADDPSMSPQAAKVPDRVALVTGGGQRIGQAIVEELASAGWSVAIHFNRSAEPAQKLAARIEALGGRAQAFGADLSDADSPGSLVARVADAMGPLTGLVNNASLFRFDTVDSATVDGWDAHLDTNLRGPAFLARAFARYCDPEGTPAIVNILDQKVVNLNPDFFSYTVSKLALEGLTRLLACAWAGRIRVHGIAPGLTLPSDDQTDEEFVKAHAAAPLGLGSTPRDIARAVRFILETPSYRGDLLIVDGGQHLQPRARDVMFEIREDKQ